MQGISTIILGTFNYDSLNLTVTRQQSAGALVQTPVALRILAEHRGASRSHGAGGSRSLKGHLEQGGAAQEAAHGGAPQLDLWRRSGEVGWEANKRSTVINVGITRVNHPQLLVITIDSWYMLV